MHPDVEKYNDDPRGNFLLGTKLYQSLYLYAADKIVELDWHWLRYHFSKFPPIILSQSLITACAALDQQIDGLGKEMIDRIVSLNGRNRDLRHYEAILQIFSEIVSVNQAFSCVWPSIPMFHSEPSGNSGKKPELLVRSDSGRTLFEVKAPGLIDHARQRAENPLQIPGRSLTREHIESLAGGRPLTLPRDNPLKDFLISANEKFADFDQEDGCNILIVIWDDHIYEPIAALVNERTGLLTANSFYRDERDRPIEFPYIDAVIVLRHMNYFISGLAEHPLSDRENAFDFGGEEALPNVFFPTTWGRQVPKFITEGFRAIDYRDECLANMAEYRIQDIIMWIESQ